MFSRIVTILFFTVLMVPVVVRAADFSLVSVIKATTTATVTIKAAAPSSIQSVNLTLLEYPYQTSSPSFAGEFGYGTPQTLAADGSFKEKFSGLKSGTKYRMTVSATGGGYTGLHTETVGEFTTSGVATPVQIPNPPQAPNVLPVEFLKDKTVVEAKKIVLTVSNTSSENLSVEVFALGSTGSVIESRKTDVLANTTALLTFTTAIKPEETYDFRMIGRRPTDTDFNRYTAVDYKGVTTPKVTIVTGGQSGGSTTGQQTATVADVQTGKSLTGATSVGDGTCGDGKDNDGDGKRDWDGVASGGIPQYQPDPACLNPDMTEEADVVAKGSWIPCTNKCDLPSVFVFINSIIEKLITVILFPISVLMFVYAGYRYITAQGNPSKKADIKKMLRNLILGIIIILISWVAVQTALQVVGYTDSLYFF